MQGSGTYRVRVEVRVSVQGRSGQGPKSGSALDKKRNSVAE